MSGSAPRRVAVIGAGHNGLIAALILARAGVEVTVLEANAEPGGCIWTEPLPGGYRLERGALEHGGLRSLADELDLAAHGLRFATRDAITGMVVGDRSFVFDADADASAARLGDDGPAYADLVRLAGVLDALLTRFPVPPTPTELGAVLARMPGGDDLFRLLLSPATTVLHERFHDEDVVSALAIHASIGQQPPWSPGTGAFVLSLPTSHGHANARPIGGSAAVVDALVAALSAAGGRLRTSSPVRSMRAEGGAVRVEAGDAEVLEVDAVVSTIDVVRTTRLLADPPAALERAARRFAAGRLNVGECKVDVALERVSDLGPLAAAPDAIWFLQQHRGSIERSTAEAMGGTLADDLPVMFALPSRSDPSAAPPDGDVAWVSAFVPLHPREGAWTPGLEQTAAARMLATVRATTGIDLQRGAVATRITGPDGWIGRMGGAGGNPNHLDLSLDQLLGWRPPDAAVAAALPTWLSLAGAGTHPGGGLTGTSGAAVARALIAGGRRGARRRGIRDEVASLAAGLRLYLTLRGGRRGDQR